MKRFPVYQPHIDAREKELVVDCMDSTWISSRGKYVDLFEKQLAELAGVEHAIAMHNGTHPLHIACLLAGVGAGDEVIVPVFSYVATANAVAYCGAKPVFVDVSPDDWNIDIAKVRDKISERTKAIIAVDIYGYPANYPALREVADEHNIILIADSAESIGSSLFGKTTAELADYTTYSFFGNKTITTGEGGALLTNHTQAADLARQLKNQGNSTQQRYYHDVLGYNYRMTNIQAAIGVGQLEKLPGILDRKRAIYERYRSHLESVAEFQAIHPEYQSSFWLVSFCLPAGINRDKVMEQMDQLGIETRPFFIALDQLPYFEEGNFPVAYDISERGISVPSYPGLKDEDVDFISRCLTDIISKNT